MEREEPTLGKAPDMSDIEFRPKSYQGPSREIGGEPILTARDEGWIWKLALATGAAVLAALMIFNAYERHQTRKDIEAIAKALEIETKKAEADFERQLRAITAHAPPVPRQYNSPSRRPAPLKTGERCIQGRRLERIENGWKQINEPC